MFEDTLLLRVRAKESFRVEVKTTVKVRVKTTGKVRLRVGLKRYNPFLLT